MIMTGPNNKQLSYGVELNILGSKKFEYKIYLFNHDKMTVKLLRFRNINRHII